jgi:hypothetical protein
MFFHIDDGKVIVTRWRWDCDEACSEETSSRMLTIIVAPPLILRVDQFREILLCNITRKFFGSNLAVARINIARFRCKVLFVGKVNS